MVDLVKLKKRRTMWMAAIILFSIAGLGIMAESMKLAVGNFIISGIYAFVYVKGNANIKRLEAQAEKA